MAVDHDRLYHAGELPVACAGCGWDNDRTLTLIDRYATDYPPVPRGNGDRFIEAYRDTGGDPDDRISFCPKCDTYLDRDGCIAREQA